MSKEPSEVQDNTPDQADTIEAGQLVNLYGAQRLSPVRIAGPRPTKRFEAGTLLSNRFLIIRFLGSGGMGEVYEAQDLLLKGPAVALKIISPNMAGSPGSQERFEREILLARQVTHPNVCPIYDIFYHDDRAGRFCFLCMKLLHGETLAARLDRTGRLAVDEAVAVARQIAAALNAAHKEGIIHRDVKPANIMLEGAGASVKAVVTDFGLARKHGGDSTFPGQTQVAGTPGYLAPELLKGHPASAASDLYAFGVVLQEMFNGKKPSGQRETPKPRLPSSAAFIGPLIAQCLGDDPERRNQAFERAKSDLEAESAIGGITFLPTQWSRRKLLSAGAAAGACALLGEAIWKKDEVIDSLNPLPRKRFVALVSWPTPADNQLASTLSGVMDAMEKELSRAEAFDHDLLVLPSPPGTREATQLNTVRDQLGANLVLASSAVSDAKTVRLSLKILGEKADQILRHRVIECSQAELSLLPGRAVQAAAQLLGVAKYLQSASTTLGIGTESPKAYKLLQDAQAARRKPNDAGLDEAIEKYKESLDEDSVYVEALASLAMAYCRYYAIHKEPAALDLVEANAKTALAVNSNQPEAHLALGWAFEHRGQRDRALAEMNRALALDPTNPSTLIWMGRVYARLNDWKKAEDLFGQVLSARPNYWLGYNELGEVYNRQGKLNEALSAYRSASLVQPKNAMPLGNVGEVLIVMGQLREARAALEQSLSLNPTGLVAANLARVLRLQGLSGEAVNCALKAVKLDSTDGENWLELGDCYSRLADHQAQAQDAYSQAEHLAERQLQVNQTDGPGLMLLALYQAKTGKPELALKTAVKAESMGAVELDSQLFKARILELAKQREAALQTLSACFSKGATKFEISTIPDLESMRLDARYLKVFNQQDAKSKAAHQ